MITEDYCSFETAKLLKNKGFGGECFSMYVTPKPHSGMGNPNEAKIVPHGRDSHYYEGYEYQCEAPTIQMAMKWLREVHNISIEPLVDFGSGDEYWWTADVGYIKKDGLIDELCGYNSYEQAAGAAIKYCLENLI